jgi:acetolactate synthase small subunit
LPGLRDVPPLGLVEVSRTGVVAIARGPEAM